MTLALCWSKQRLNLVAGYENGLATVFQLTEIGAWVPTYKAQIHSQPILSLDVQPDLEIFLTSGVDALIVKHPIPNSLPLPTYSVPILLPTSSHAEPGNAGRPSLLSSDFAHAAESLPHRNQPEAMEIVAEGQPVKAVNTKHSGQQGLRVRSDGRIFATAGWDSRIRIYSTRTMRELAVLQWHQMGSYTVAFAVVRDQVAADIDSSHGSEQEKTAYASVEPQARDTGFAVTTNLVETSVKERRLNHAKTAHWLAAGSKDGKVSLWDVY